MDTTEAHESLLKSDVLGPVEMLVRRGEQLPGDLPLEMVFPLL